VTGCSIFLFWSFLPKKTKDQPISLDISCGLDRAQCHEAANGWVD
jgi:hypothetical protein